MTIINPASENQNYCIGSNSATWFVNGNQLISFSQSDLTNGTKFVKQTINGLPYKIIWDGGGNGKEHIINNPNNYSYSIKQNGEIIYENTTYSVLAPVSYTAPFDYEIIDFDSTGTTINLNKFDSGFKNIPFLGAWEGFYPQMPQYAITKITYYLHYTAYKLDEYCRNYPNFWPKTSVNFPFDDNGGYFNNSGNIFIKWKLRRTGANQLQIIDNGQTYNYSITNTNSVEIIYSSGEIKYTFSANMQSVSQTYQTPQTISLKCGLDCPSDTCVKCRNGDFVCCYNNDGTVIERIYDPNFEIEAC